MTSRFFLGTVPESRKVRRSSTCSLSFVPNTVVGVSGGERERKQLWNRVGCERKKTKKEVPIEFERGFVFHIPKPLPFKIEQEGIRPQPCHLQPNELPTQLYRYSPPKTPPGKKSWSPCIIRNQASIASIPFYTIHTWKAKKKLSESLAVNVAMQ